MLGWHTWLLVSLSASLLACLLITATAAQATYEAARYVPVVSTTVALAVGVANLSRQYGAYGIAGFLHRADIAKVEMERVSM